MKKQILAAVYNENDIEQLKNALGDVYDVQFFDSGRELAENLRGEENRCTAIIVDISNRNVFELPQLRHTFDTKVSAPIVALADLSDTEGIERAFSLGIDEIIERPIVKEVILNRLSRLFESNEHTLYGKMTYNMFVNRSSDIFFFYNRKRDTLELSPNGVSMFKTNTVIRRPLDYLVISDIITEDMFKEVKKSVAGATPERTQLGIHSIRIKHNGVYCLFYLSADALFGSEGDFLGVTGRLSIVDQSFKEQELFNKLYISGVTNVFNRKYYDDVLVHERLDAIAIVDVDNFGLFNKKYGHTIGDKVLKSVAMIIEKETMGTGTPTRYGGDEFVIGFRADKESCKIVLDRICSQVKMLKLPECEDTTISVTIGCYHGKESNKEKLEKADEIMFNSKKIAKGSAYINE